MNNEIDMNAVEDKLAQIYGILNNGYYKLDTSSSTQLENEASFAGAAAALEWILNDMDGGFADLDDLISVADTDLAEIRSLNGL